MGTQTLSRAYTHTHTQSPSFRRTHQIPNVVKTAENLHFSQILWSVHICECFPETQMNLHYFKVCGILKLVSLEAPWSVSSTNSHLHLSCGCASLSKLSSPAQLLLLLPRPHVLSEGHLGVCVCCWCDCRVRIIKWTVQRSSGIKHL